MKLNLFATKLEENHTYIIKNIVKRIAAMGAAVMMMSSMAIGASAYNSGDTYSSATWTISAKYTQNTKSITKTLKAGY